MRIVLIYLLFFTFYINEVMGPTGFLPVKGFSLLNLNIYLLLLVWGLRIARKRTVIQSNNLNKYLVLMAFIMLMSIFIKILLHEIPNINVKTEMTGFKQWLNPILLFFILFNIIDDRETCNRALSGLSFLFAALILTQLSATFGITNYQAHTIHKYGRAGGFGAPGEYAITLALFFPFVVSRIFFAHKYILSEIGYIILGFLMLVGLVNAGSRNGAVSCLFGLMVYFLMLKRKKIIGVAAVVSLVTVMVIAGVTAFVVSPSSVKVKVVGRFEPLPSEDLSTYTSGRTEIWENGWKLFIARPFIGHGRDTFKTLSVLHFAPHNEYLKYLTEQGLIGLIAFLLIFYKIFRNMGSALGKTGDSRGKLLYISYIAGLSGYMLGMFATNAGPSLFIFWIYTALIYKYAQLDMAGNETSESVNVALVNSPA